MTDYPILLIEANRWRSSHPGCAGIDDPFGMFISADGTPPPGVKPFPASIVTPWAKAFRAANYVVLSYGHSNFVPFTPALSAAFARKFVAIYRSPHTVIYRARALGGAG